MGVLPSLDVVRSLKDEGKPVVITDCTLGGAGHALRVMEKWSEVRRTEGDGVPPLVLVGVDRDETAMSVAHERVVAKSAALGLSTDAFTFLPLRMNFLDAPAAIDARFGAASLAALYADFGVSSPQLDIAARGFSFLREGPLDMRMDAARGATARDLLLESDEKELARIFFEYGEEPKARKLAHAICQDRSSGRLKVSNTVEFAEYVRAVLGYHQSKVHPATRTFQALRIAVNGELEAIEGLLDACPALARGGAKVGFISFHSLEDRLVKQRFRAWQDGKARPDPKRRDYEAERYAEKSTWGKETPRGGIEASEAERAANPRARSARLRVFTFLETRTREGKST